MTWREDLRRVSIAGKQFVGASFRGKPFLVESSERSGGRRAVVHEFPLRDDPFIEDMGRKARTFRLDGYVIGDDYLAQRDSLLAALEAVERPGLLIHPYYGRSITAVCISVTVRDTKAEGGFAQFAIEFAEAPAQAPTPVIVDDSASKVSSSADAAAAASRAELVQKYRTQGVPGFAFVSAATALTSAATKLGSILAPAVTITQELATLTGQIQLLTSTATSLVRSPGDLFDSFHAAITGLGSTIQSAPGAVMRALIDAMGVDMGPDVVETTATRETERANQVALAGALRRVMALEAARLAPLATFVSIEEATDARDRIAAMLESEAAGAGDTAYPALVTLRSDLLTAVPGGATLARIVTVTRRVAIPSLVLSYQLYGSVDQEADILARNAIRHPGLVAGDLKVLSA
jgi:prophage DNA circulation protein